MKKPYNHAYFIPIHIDSLVVDREQSMSMKNAAGQLTDFSLLPHRSQKNENRFTRIRPNVSEDLVSKPFEATNDPLGLGVHLHWTLPKEFRRVKIQDSPKIKDGTKPEPKFRNIPNRWFIQRKIYEINSDEIASYKSNEFEAREWIIESDALSTSNLNDSCAFPYLRKHQTNMDGYKYLGRVFRYQDWIKHNKSKNENEYVEDLTAFGYGEALYGAYYPECRNVLGFHDTLRYDLKENEFEKNERPQSLLDIQNKYFELRYKVVGWYENITDDPLSSAQFKIKKDENLKHRSNTYLIPEMIDPISEHKEIFNWRVSYGESLGQNKHLKANIIRRDLRTFMDWKNKNLPSRHRELLEKDPFALFDTHSCEGLNEVMSSINTDHDVFESEASIYSRIGDFYQGQSIAFGQIKKIHIPVISQKNVVLDKIEKELVKAEKFKSDSIKRRDEYLENLKKKPDWEKIKDSKKIKKGQNNASLLLAGMEENISILKKKIEKLKSSKDSKDKNRSKPPKIVLAQTPGQAFASLLAHHHGGNTKNIEAMLDAIQLGIFESENAQDFPARLEEGLHKSGFTAKDGERKWLISYRDKDIEAARIKRQYGEEDVVEIERRIPEHLNILIDKINKLQRKIDKTSFEIAQHQTEIYADWYKFMLAEYDFDLNEITFEGHVNAIREFLANKEVFLNQLKKDLKTDQNKLQDFIRDIQKKIKLENDKNVKDTHELDIHQDRMKRYWEPNEPVLLFYGEDVVTSKKYNQDDQPTQVILFPQFFKVFDHNREDAIINYVKTSVLDWVAENVYDPEQWNPLFLDWHVELYPLAKPGNVDYFQKDWPSDAFISQFEIDRHQTDLGNKSESYFSENKYKKWLEFHPDIQMFHGKRVQTFEGRSILTPNAHKSMLENIKSLIEKLEPEENVDEISRLQNMVKNLDEFPVLSQSLSGFNDALLMKKQILQLNIHDPLAVNNVLKEFTEEIAKLVGDQNKVSPLPSNIFMPMMEGALRLRKIRMVDMWGRSKEWDISSLSTYQSKEKTNRLLIANPFKQKINNKDDTKSSLKEIAFLKPRVVQPCRLNFQWLNSEQEESASTDFDHHNPICGFILPNFLNKSLHLFDQVGKPIGILVRHNREIVINPYPGYEKPGKIVNKHFNKFVSSIKALGEEGDYFLSKFLQIAQDALGASLAENYAQFDGMCLLMGRPLAMVRASLDLELKGLPAIDQSWASRESEYLDKQNISSRSMGFDKLRFSLRIGDYFKAGDGTIAFYHDHEKSNPLQIFSHYSESNLDRLDNFWAKLDQEESWSNFYKNRSTDLFEAYHKAQNDIKEIQKLLKEEEKKSLPYLNMLNPFKFITELPEFIKKVEELKNPNSDRKKYIDRLNIKIEQLNELKISGEFEIPINEWMKRKEVIDDYSSALGFNNSLSGLFKPPNDLFAVSLRQDSSPLNTGIFMDPRGACHITTGILPVEKQSIPTKYYAEALKKIEMAILITPIISPKPSLIPFLPLTPSNESNSNTEGASQDIQSDQQKFFLVSPRQQGYVWHWHQHFGVKDWKWFNAENIEQPPNDFLGDFEPQSIYEGWMTLKPKEIGPQKK